ncbi:alpha/beta fold hydrolase [Serinicoccus sp. LYQ131]|uniref:alpha/beta fold hydrolase n=1 Tax=Serinicoccus sp. LYQ131 TaxID=3378797 RepID=UPI003854EE15
MGEFVTRDGCTIRYQDTEAAPGRSDETIVLLSGWSQTAAMYDRLVKVLDGRYRTVVYDYRNHGRSGASDNGARIASLATDLRELLDHLGITRAHLTGNSMGCSVLYSFVDLYGTERVRSLVLIDQPSVCALVPWLTQEDAGEVGAIMDFAGAAGFVEGLLGPDAEAVRRNFLRSMVFDDISEEDFAYLLEQNMTLRMPYGARLVLDHVMQDWRDVLPRIDVPTLVTGGKLSHVDATSQRWIAGQIPGAQLEVFTRAEGGDHFPFFENPEHFAAVYTRFIDSVAT